MLLTAYTGGRCFLQFTAGCQSYTLTAAQLTISFPFCFFGPYIEQSQEGAHQGDPIGPLLFCNTVHPLLSSLQSKLNIGFLDDVTLGGHVDVVASDAAEIIRLGAEIATYPSASSLHIVTCSSMTLCFSRLAEPTLLTQPYWERVCFKAQFLTTLGTSAVTTSRELLTGWVPFFRSMHW